MKKIFIILFIFYLSFINYAHDFNYQEKMVFIDEALSYLKSKYEQFSQNCDDSFSAKISFGVLFTDENNFDKDINNIKDYFSSNVIEYISEVDTEKALIDEENKNGDTQKKLLFIEIKKKMMINGHFLSLK